MHTSDSSFNITSTTFTNNSADRGGVTHAITQSSFNILSSSFYANKADSYVGIVVTTECSTYITNGAFDYNLGSLYVFNSNFNFSGYTRFENCTESLSGTANDIEACPEGGAITSFQFTVIFTGVCTLSNNQARYGGALLATESKVMVYGE